MSQPVIVYGYSRRAPPPTSKPPLRERVAALRYVPRLLRLVWETHRGYTIAMLLLRLVQSVVPVANLWIAKLVIDEVVRLAQQRGGDASHLWALVATEVGVVVGGDLLARVSSLTEGLLGELFSNRISVRLMQHAATLDLQQFEDPTFYDHLERARQSTGGAGLMSQLLRMGQDTLTLVSFTLALAAQEPWLVLLLVVTVLPGFLGETHFSGTMYALRFRRTSERRQLDYLRWVGATKETAKEVQLFGLGTWLVDRYRRLADQFYRENRQLWMKRSVVVTGLALIGTLGYYTAAVVVLRRAITGAISIGTLTFLTTSFQRSRGLIQGLLMGVNQIFEQSLYLKDLFVFFDMKPTIISRPDARPVPRPIREGFRFEDVGFRYPDSERWAVRHVSFTLRPGERVALVGENGAGKTTLTKLLARLYDPTEGRILLDGVDLRDYDLSEVRRAIGVIFQDFVRYDMRFDENVGVGEVEEVREYLDAGGDGAAPPPTSIVNASEKSLASSLLPRFKGAYRQMLGRRFGEGAELSGGEWQKVALARAYMRDAQVLILDEPTASLDARAEYDVFLRFNALMAGRMAIVISHRFSTVRMADRIIVLQSGEIVEQGTHEELVSADGLYAELFGMQAAGYR
jgi:ATP-binding cassette subfamily B protein